MIFLLAHGGPWSGSQITLEYPSGSPQFQWATDRIGAAVQIEHLYEAKPCCDEAEEARIQAIIDADKG